MLCLHFDVHLEFGISATDVCHSSAKGNETSSFTNTYHVEQRVLYGHENVLRISYLNLNALVSFLAVS